MINGCLFLEAENTLPERSYRAVNVRTRLNLRAGPSTKTAITGKYVRNNIVRVQLVISGSKTSKCRSGRWAMLFANGAGIGYVCENFLMAAPEGISDRDISAFQKPDRGRVIQERNSTIDRQITRVKAPVRRLSSSKPQKTAERANKKKTGKSSEWASYSGAYARADIGE